MDTPALCDTKPLSHEEKTEKFIAEKKAEIDILVEKAQSPIIYFPPKEE